MFDPSHMQLAALGLGIISMPSMPKIFANLNVPPIDPDDPPAGSALEPPKSLEDELRGYVGASPAQDTARSVNRRHIRLVREPIYGGKYIEPTQLCHRFCLWMVENTSNDWLLWTEVDDYMEVFCREHNYCEPDWTNARSIIAGLLQRNYRERQRINQPEYAGLRARLNIRGSTQMRPTIYRFTKALARHLTCEFNALEKSTSLVPASSHLSTGTTGLEAGLEPGPQGLKIVSRNKKTRKSVSKKTKKPTKSAHYLDDDGWSKAA